MNVKRYFAKNMHEAMNQIREELGSNAVILTQKSVRAKGLRGLFSKPKVEVTVAYEPSGRQVNIDNAVTEKPSMPQITPATQTDERFEQLDEKLTELNNMMKNVSGKIGRKLADGAKFSDEIKPLLARLLDAEIQEELAYAIATETQSIVEKVGGDPADTMKQIIKQCIGEPETIKLKKFKQNVLMFVGPTGVGKTTSLVKLAAAYAVTGEKKVGLVNGDTYRIAAQDQLRTYSEIMGAPLEVIYSPQEAAQALKTQQNCEMVFIDTPGKKPFDEQHKMDVRQLIEITNPDEVFLCISASTGNRACRDIIENYAFLPKYKLIVTKVDETSCMGLLLNACYYSSQPLSYVANGQSVPDDIGPVNADAIAESIMGGM